MDPVTISNLIVAIVGAVGGYLVKHYGLLGGSTTTTPIVVPVVPLANPVAPAVPGSSPGFLGQLEAMLAQEAQAFIQSRLKDIMAPPAVVPAPVVPAVPAPVAK